MKSNPDTAFAKRAKRILVACDTLVMSGGLLRFERMGNVLCKWGHEVAFVTLSNKNHGNWQTKLPVLNLKQATEAGWDAVMIPGAGFPDDTIERFSVFQKDNFGVRVQHILNDESRRKSFLKVNRTFNPHIVIFNNTSWIPGSFTDFKGDKFYTLLGGVDVEVFKFEKPNSVHLGKDKWIIGAQAKKNPEPLIRALDYLPSFVALKMFGEDTHQLASKYPDLVKSGRLVLVGILPDDETMSSFYKNIDCVVMTEDFAGWANMVAEAFASGVPVVCTPHGTTAFARHELTALVIERPTATSVATEVNRLIQDPNLCSDLIKHARTAIEGFTWGHYSERLLDLIQHDGIQHYTFAPEVGLFGKWPVTKRLHGLEALLTQARGAKVIDFGAAEGLVAHEFLKHGASKVVGFELDAARVKKANELCTSHDAEFIAADLSDWDFFLHSYGSKLKDEFEIVLYLGIQHHLPVGKRLKTLFGAADLAKKFFAIRTTSSVYEMDNIDHVMRLKGFHLISNSSPNPVQESLGLVRVYGRNAEDV